MYIVFNVINIHALMQFYCNFENSEQASKICDIILHK